MTPTFYEFLRGAGVAFDPAGFTRLTDYVTKAGKPRRRVPSGDALAEMVVSELLDDFDPGADPEAVAESMYQTLRGLIRPLTRLAAYVQDYPDAHTPRLAGRYDDRRFRAIFVPQRWGRRGRVRVRTPAPAVWDATGFLTNPPTWAQGPNIFPDLVSDLSDGDGLSGTDGPFLVLREDPAAPAWIRRWSGPFTIYVQRTDPPDATPGRAL